MGDLNAKVVGDDVDKASREESMGSHGVGSINESSELFGNVGIRPSSLVERFSLTSAYIKQPGFLPIMSLQTKLTSV